MKVEEILEIREKLRKVSIKPKRMTPSICRVVNRAEKKKGLHGKWRSGDLYYSFISGKNVKC